ncbi:MAG: polysaccharide biosynthesis tyrosine autokinase [Oscillospiraceae bacterium]|nr:polysaccharide biosynthesis tyrosine autokinase [Oscillospiraceae bacterium]
MNNENTIDLRDLLRLFLSKIWIIIAVTLCGGIISFCISKFVLPMNYSSHISMYVQSYTNISENPADNQNDISNSKKLINTYIQVLKDDAVMRAVSEKLEEQYDDQILKQNFSLNNGCITPDSLRSCISISSVTDTSALKVITTAKNPEVAASICNNLAAVAEKYIQEAVGIGSISTIDKAKVYRNPVAPNIPKNTLMGMTAGFMLILMIIFLIDFFDNSIKDTEVLTKKYNKAILGEIQHFVADKRKPDSRKSGDYEHIRLTDKDLPFYIVESYKSIRTNIAFALSTSERKILAVSSANAREGKSTTSANIAIASAQGGNKVLLIDADMRKAVLHKIFGLQNKNGLSSVISRMDNLEECIKKNVMENLDVLTSGPIPPNPSELLASEYMSEILNQLSEQYTLIVIDTPPVNVVTDAMELAKSVSDIIIVLRCGRTTTNDIDEIMNKIKFAHMNMLGFVVNDGKTKRNGKYGYKSGYGYGYGTNSESEFKSKEW